MTFNHLAHLSASSRLKTGITVAGMLVQCYRADWRAGASGEVRSHERRHPVSHLGAKLNITVMIE